MQAEIATSPDFDVPISDDWKVGFAEDQLTTRQNAESFATANHELELALRLCRDDIISKSDGWKAFTIFAACHVCQQAGRLAIFEEDLWHRLEVAAQATSESFSDILSALVARAGKGGLGLTQSVAETIEALARTDSTEAEDGLKCLLPLVEQASPSEVARLRRWVGLEGLDNVKPNVARLLSQHATLILAERVPVLEVAWMRPVMDLAQRGDDRSKARVVQTLTSPISAVTRGIRRRHLSALGLNAAKEMVLCYLQTSGDAEPVLNGSVCLDELHYDDPSIISQLGALNAPGATGISALPFVLGCGTWTAETLDVFAQWLNEDSNRWHDAFVVGFGSLLFYQESEVPASLRASARRSIVSRKLVVHLLDEDSSYAEVMKVCQAALDEKPVALAVSKASALLRESCRIEFSENFSEAEIDSNCAALGRSSMQAQGTIPEDCWDVVSPEMDNERLFELVANWLAMELESWSKSRRVGLRPQVPADIYSLRLRNALLSILTVMTERWRDKFALMASNQQQVGTDLCDLLAEAAIYHGLLRAKSAAITLLSRLPSLNAETVAQVFRAAVAADPIVRDRAVMLLPHFRYFVPTPKFLKSGIEALKGDASASVVLAHAHLLARLLKENKVADPRTRREIVNVLRSAAKAARNVRLLSHLAGSGNDDDPRHVVNDGRLDEKLVGIVASI